MVTCVVHLSTHVLISTAGTWTIDYTLSCYDDVLNYPYPNGDAGCANRYAHNQFPDDQEDIIAYLGGKKTSNVHI